MVHPIKKATHRESLNIPMPDMFRNLGSEVMKNCSQMFTESMALSKEMFACRTSKEMIEIQEKASQLLCDSYFKRTNKLRSMMLDACEDSFSSISKRNSVVAEELQRIAA